MAGRDARDFERGRRRNGADNEDKEEEETPIISPREVQSVGWLYLRELHWSHLGPCALYCNMPYAGAISCDDQLGEISTD